MIDDIVYWLRGKVSVTLTESAIQELLAQFDSLQSRLDKLQKDYAQQCEINDSSARSILSQGDEIERLESRLDAIRELLKGDEVGEWKELMALVNGPAVERRAPKCFHEGCDAEKAAGSNYCDEHSPAHWKRRKRP